MRRHSISVGWPGRDSRRCRFAVPNTVWEYHLRPVRFVIFSYPCYHRSQGQVSQLTPEIVAERVHLSASTTKKHLEALVDRGIVTAELSLTLDVRHITDKKFFSLPNEVYPNFPIPRLVFGFKYLFREKKVAQSCLCVVKDQRLTLDTPLYAYPFSNVHGDNSICLGNNALPVYKDPARLHTLAAYILRFPNNNDMYSSQNNKLNLEYRDLLEQMKGKEPSVYYSHVLKERQETLKDFLNTARR